MHAINISNDNQNREYLQQLRDCAQMSKTTIAVRHFELGGRESLETAVRDVTRTLIGRCLFMYSCSARRISFEFELISKEIKESCLIFKYIRALSSFAPPGKKILRTALVGHNTNI